MSTKEEVKLTAAHGFEGKVTFLKCRWRFNRIELFDANGKSQDRIVLAKDIVFDVDVEDMDGSGRPVFLVTYYRFGRSGSSSDSTTELIEIEGGRLHRVRFTSEVGEEGTFALVRGEEGIRSWWFSKARASRGLDVFQIGVPSEDGLILYRYAFEDGRWLRRKGIVKNWRDNHRDRRYPDAEFP